MWKARETHLVDVFKCSQPEDDFYLSTVAVNGTDAEVFCCCSSSSSSSSSCAVEKSQQQIGKIQEHENCNWNEYRGNDFGIFGKEKQEKQQFLIDQFAPMQQSQIDINDERINCCCIPSSSLEEKEQLWTASGRVNAYSDQRATGDVSLTAATIVTPSSNQSYSISSKRDGFAYYWQLL